MMRTMTQGDWWGSSITKNILGCGMMQRFVANSSQVASTGASGYFTYSENITPTIVEVTDPTVPFTYAIQCVKVSGADQFWQQLQSIKAAMWYTSGKTVTLSFWARCLAGTSTWTPTVRQSFGTGGSAIVDKPGSSVTLTSSWKRYSVTVTLDSIASKTFASTDFCLSVFCLVGAATQTFELTGVQLELGPTATTFNPCPLFIQNLY